MTIRTRLQNVIFMQLKAWTSLGGRLQIVFDFGSKQKG
ncbi:hypothetical protein SLEP1_g41932 [Rubroshorea leprosula]|uniref:Uncharacterized protein n=1 Tax=Rubroshorea leprosula TaxID=152421 RepID=A0AAV5L837_9ROSI|nr:hypothetical protein SLEP1_g41932 [Rubroshorea leprosula]